MAALLAEACVSPRRDPQDQALTVATSIVEKMILKARRRKQLEVIAAARRAQAAGDEKKLEELVRRQRLV
jgi:hypothetical protein